MMSSNFFFFFYLFISPPTLFFFFFFNDTATTEIYTLSLHDALPTAPAGDCRVDHRRPLRRPHPQDAPALRQAPPHAAVPDRALPGRRPPALGGKQRRPAFRDAAAGPGRQIGRAHV